MKAIIVRKNQTWEYKFIEHLPYLEMELSGPTRISRNEEELSNAVKGKEIIFDSLGKKGDYLILIERF